MVTRRFRPPRRPRPPEEIAKTLAEARDEAARRRQDYRARSLALHGWICARCAREFEADTLHLLTVHHRDGNHDNNPPDGSNWENLCAYCHDAEHSKNLLADYLDGATREPPRRR
jgi:cytochrome c553